MSNKRAKTINSTGEAWTKSKFDKLSFGFYQKTLKYISEMMYWECPCSKLINAEQEFNPHVGDKKFCTLVFKYCA